MNNTVHENTIRGLALVPTVVDDSPTVGGAAIVLPWKKGRKLTFDVVASAMTTYDALTVKPQMRRKGTSTWDDMKEGDGTTTLQFTAAETADGGDLDGGHLSGTLDLERLTPPSEDYEYDAIRIAAVNAVAQNVTVAATYTISDLYAVPGPGTDDLLAKQLFA